MRIAFVGRGGGRGSNSDTRCAVEYGGKEKACWLLVAKYVGRKRHGEGVPEHQAGGLVGLRTGEGAVVMFISDKEGTW